MSTVGFNKTDNQTQHGEYMQNKDRRYHERTPIQTRASIGINNLVGDCILMDFSSHGLGMLLENNMFIDIGQKLLLNLETGSKSTTVQDVFKWARKLKESGLFNYAIGMEFTEFDTDGYGNLLQHAQS